MARLPQEALKKLAGVEMIAEINDNFDIIDVLNKLIYIPGMSAPAATDGKVIYVSDGLFKYSPKGIYFIINHEFDHIYYRHVKRFSDKGTNRYIMNIATDLIINEILVREGISMPREGDLEVGVTRAKIQKEVGFSIRGQNSKAVYLEILEFYKKKREERKQQMKEQLEQQMKQKQEQQGQGQQGEGQEGSEDENQEQQEGQQGSGSGDGQEQQNQENQQSSGSGQEQQMSPEDLDILKELLGEMAEDYKDKIDKEAESIQQAKSTASKQEQEAGKSASKQEEGLNEDGTKKEPEKSLAEQIAEAKETMNEKVVTKAGAAGKGRQAETDRNYTPPKIDWKKLLKQFLGRYLKRKEKRNIMRPTNRYDDIFRNSQVLIPSNRGYVQTPKINVYLDISGSMGGVIGNVRQIIEDAKSTFKKYKGKYYEFNTSIYEFKRTEFYKSKNLSGGTDIKKVLRHYIEDKSADLGILITDAGDSFSEELEAIKKPTLILTDNKGLTTNNKKVTIVHTDFK